MEVMFSKSYVKVESSFSETDKKDITECLKEYAGTKKDVEAIVFASTDGQRQSVTWSQLYDRSCSVARSLIHLGVKQKEIVAVNLRSCPEWLYVTFGAMLAGAIPVSVSFTYTDGSDLVALMKKLKICSLIVLDPGLGNVNWIILRGLLDDYDASGKVKSTRLPYLRYLLCHKFEKSLDNDKRLQDIMECSDTEIPLPDIGSDDIATMLQTSGSTGVPKLVVYTHRSLVNLICTDLTIVDSTYILYNDRPFNWIGGFPLSVLTGQTRVTISGFCEVPLDRVSFMIDVITKERCTIVLTLPPIMTELIFRKDGLPDDWPVIGIMTGGQPITSHLTECIGKIGKFLSCIYGGSEFVALTQNMITDPQTFKHFGCGKPIKVRGLEIKIVDGAGQITPVNTMGEIYARSPVMFSGYYNDPGKTKAALSDDGWFKTDDLGQMTENGEFFVVGRKSRMIISGGMNIAPEILENAMKNFPGVESAVIVPLPDDIFYQVICACVKRKPGSDVTEEQIRRYCEEFHADKPGVFTVLPKFYVFIAEIPETKNGKTDVGKLTKIAQNFFKR